MRSDLDQVAGDHSTYNRVALAAKSEDGHEDKLPIPVRRAPREGAHLSCRRWYLPLAAIVPIAFIAYCSRYLGRVDGVRNFGKSVFRLTPYEVVTCILTTAWVAERGMVWPLLAQLIIGTACWVASLVATIRVRSDATRVLVRSLCAGHRMQCQLLASRRTDVCPPFVV